MSFEIRDVGHFLRAAQLGGMGKAAEATGLSQPAITKAIARLEHELGLRLFERTRQGLVLTGAGEAFRARAERMLAEYEDTMRMAGDLRVGATGLLRLGSSAAAHESYVSPALARLLQRRPRLRTRLSVRLSSELLAPLRAGQFDVVVATREAEVEAGLDSEVLGHDELVVVAAQRHPLFRRAAPTLADLARYPWVLPREPLAARRWIVDEFRRAGLPPPTPSVEIDQGTPGAIALAAATELLTLAAVPRQRRQWPVPVRRVEVPGLVLARPIAVFTRANAHRSPALEAFLDALPRAAGAGPA